MHMTIIAAARFAGNTTASLLLLMGLKTLADWSMHVVEHREPHKATVAR